MVSRKIIPSIIIETVDGLKNDALNRIINAIKDIQEREAVFE
ncbi:MAG: hypothetical protein PF505_15010 [Vallitaleaceae bacterium]|nr:hypothetical protein [Vallitaleaceae bacterium]